MLGNDVLAARLGVGSTRWSPLVWRSRRASSVLQEYDRRPGDPSVLISKRGTRWTRLHRREAEGRADRWCEYCGLSDLGSPKPHGKGNPTCRGARDARSAVCPGRRTGAPALIEASNNGAARRQLRRQGDSMNDAHQPRRAQGRSTRTRRVPHVGRTRPRLKYSPLRARDHKRPGTRALVADSDWAQRSSRRRHAVARVAALSRN